jgi:hypothetical protein
MAVRNKAMRKYLSLGLAALFLMQNSLWASGPGTTAANVLKVGVGARAIAMGEAHTSLADDISSLYWNPAGLAYLNQSQASFMYNQSFQDMTYNHAGLGISLESGGLGGSVSYLGFGKIDGFDPAGNPTGNVNAYSGVGTFGGGMLFDSLALGFNLKAIHSTLADEKANGAAVDLGTSFVYPQPIMDYGTLRFAATLRNLGPGMKFLHQKDPLPMEWRVGTSLHQLFNKKVTLGVDYGQARGDEAGVYAGSEFWFVPMLALRAGFAHNDVEGSGLRAGMGLRIKDLSFDYAYAGVGDLGLTHRYELTYRFGDIRPRLTPEERKLLRQARRAIREERFAEAVLILDSLMRLVPKYRLFERLSKVAMKGHEAQERLAKGQNNFNLLTVKKDERQTLPDLDDLDQLLKMSDEAEAQSAKAQKALKERKQ